MFAAYESTLINITNGFQRGPPQNSNGIKFAVSRLSLGMK